MAVKACLPLNRIQLPLSSFLFSFAPLGGLLSRMTNLCIPEKDLFDDALLAATSCFNNHQRQDNDNIIIPSRGNIIPRNKESSLERGISTYEAKKQPLGEFNAKLTDHMV